MINESDRKMGQFRKDADPVKAGLARAYHELAQTWIRAYGDFPFAAEQAATSASEASTRQRSRKESQVPSPDSLTQVVREFNAGSLTPELVTKTFQTIWQVRGESAGLEVVVPPCDRTAEDLAELAKAGRGIAYLPEQVKTQQDRPVLAKMFPRLRNYSVEEENSVTNEVDRSGWFDYEVSVDAPYRTTTEDQLREAIAAEGKRLGRDLAGMNVNEYIVAGQDSKLFTGKFLDQGATWVRLLGSRNGGDVVYAFFFSDGRLSVRWLLGSQGHDPRLGGRSVGVKKT